MRDKLKILNRPITKSDFEKIYEIYLEYNSCLDISPIKGMTRLKELYLPGIQHPGLRRRIWYPGITMEKPVICGPIADISPINRMTQLVSFSIDGVSKISDISFLQKMKDIRKLNLLPNQISDISPLKGMTQLWLADLYGNPISRSKIAELKALPNCEI